MKLSKIYLGRDSAYETAIRERVGLQYAALHRVAQRILWGILFADRLRVDMDVQVAFLMNRHGDDFIAHVLAAVARRWQARDGEAEQHLARARELVAVDHPWAYLVPDDDRWRCELPTCALAEAEPGRVYQVVSEARAAHAGPFGTRCVGTFLRVRSGALIYINPVRLDDVVLAQVRALGEVTHILSPAKYHNTYLADAAGQFPAAQIWGVPSQRGYAGTAHIRFTGFLDDAAPLFPDELDQITIHGIDVGDVFLLDRASRTLIVSDVFLVTGRTPKFMPYLSFFDEIYRWAWGLVDGACIFGYHPLIWTDFKALQRSLRRVLEHPFDHVASVHGPWHAIEGDAHAVLHRDLGWLLELSSAQRIGLTLDFARRHPAIVWRFFQVSRAQAKAEKRASVGSAR